MMSARFSKLAAISALFALVACVGCSTAREGAGPGASSASSRRSKLAPELQAWLAHAAPDARIGVVADFVNKPRQQDMLRIGLADCLGQPTTSTMNAASSLPWNSYELERPTAGFGEMCVGYATREGLLRLVDSPSVRTIERWSDH